jgi:hypothetical protein
MTYLMVRLLLSEDGEARSDEVPGDIARKGDFERFA